MMIGRANTRPLQRPFSNNSQGGHRLLVARVSRGPTSVGFVMAPAGWRSMRGVPVVILMRNSRIFCGDGTHSQPVVWCGLQPASSSLLSPKLQVGGGVRCFSSVAVVVEDGWGRFRRPCIREPWLCRQDARRLS